MKSFLIAFLLIVCASGLLRSQYDNGKFINCHSDNEEWAKWAPDPKNPDHTPIKIVPVYFHFIRNSACENNFSDETGFTAEAYIRDLLSFINIRLAENVVMTAPTEEGCISEHISDTRIRIKSMGINYVPCDDDCNSYDGNPKHWNHPCDCFVKYNVNEEHYLNIFFMEDKEPEKRRGGEAYLLNQCLKRYSSNRKDTIWFRPPTKSTTGIRLEGLWGVYASKDWGVWQANSVLMHELGHIIGQLGHAWSSRDAKGYDCCDTPRGKGDWKSNNQMDYGMGDRGFTQCQLGFIHRNLYEEYFPYLLDDYCVYQADQSIRIDSNQKVVWETARMLKGDLIIESGSSLTINCTIGLPASAKIIVESGGELNLDGALVTNICDESWSGIVTHNDVRFSKKDTRGQGIVNLYNGAKLENSVNGIKKIKTIRGKEARDKQIIRKEKKRARKGDL